jgi:O-antigen ligase
LVEDTQIGLIINRIFSVSSLLIRLEVYLQAIAVWSDSPWAILVGYGPDFLDNSGDALLSEPLKTSAITGYVEGTLDSAWLSYLVEFGLPGFLLLCALFFSCIVRACRGLLCSKILDDSAYAVASLLGGLLFLAMAMSTQMLGYSKTSWLPLQLLVVASIGLRVWRMRAHVIYVSTPEKRTVQLKSDNLISRNT